MSEPKNIKGIIRSLEDQMKNYPGLAFCKDRIHIAESFIELLKKKKFPFINIDFVSFPTGKADNMRSEDFERHEYSFNIQFAVVGKTKNLALMGIDADPDADPPVAAVPGVLDMHELIAAAITSDPTVGGIVDDLVKTPSLVAEIFRPEKDELLYVGAGELSVSFYKDVFAR